MFGIKSSKIINDINTILLPPVCFGCNAQLFRGEHLLCTVSRYDLPITDYNFEEENEIDRIFYGRVRIEKASSFLFFSKTGIVKNLLHQLKYKNDIVSVKEIQKKLNENTTILEFFVADSSTVFVYVITKHQLKIEKINT